jgi:hypothetical protein
MTIEDQFTRFVVQQNELAAEILPIDWEARKTEWLARLDGLYADIERHLEPHVGDGGIVLVRADIHMREEEIGEYEAPMLLIRIGTDEVILTPKGTNLIGATGRVDIVGSRGSAQLVLCKRTASGTTTSDPDVVAEWRFTADRHRVFRMFSFDRQSFREMLMGISGR